MFIQCVRAWADLRAELPPYLAQWGWPSTIDDFVGEWLRHKHVLNEPLLDRMVALRAAGTPCYLATVQERYRAAYIREAMSLGTRTDGMFVSCENGYLKHEPGFWEAVLSALPGFAPREVIFFDDSAGNVEAASRAGLNAHLYVSVADLDAVMAQEW